MTSRATTRARRLRGLWLVAWLCASQAGAWVHEAVVSHVTCLEHGESIHADAAPAREQPAAAAPFARLDGQPAARPGHEHCAGGALLRWRDAVLAAPVASGELSPPSLAQPARAGARDELLGRDIYLLAPKTSPPSPGA